MEEKKLKGLKVGEWFILKPIDEPKESQVYIRGEYDRGTKKYSCSKFSDVNTEIFKKGNTTVYTGFTF